MKPIDRSYIVNQLTILVKEIQAGHNRGGQDLLSDKEIARKLAEMSDLADPEAGVIYFQERDIARSKGNASSNIHTIE